METELIDFLIDKKYELDLSQNRKYYDDSFEDRYKVLNSNIELTKKIKHLAIQKQSNENIIFWNIFGFLNILALDLVSVGYNLVFEKKRWQKIYFARQVSLIIFEALKDIPEVLGKDYKQIFIGIDISQPYIDVLKSYKKELEVFKAKNQSYLYEIRVNVSAHRDQDIDKQLEIIRNIDPYKIIKIMTDFEVILRKITDHIQKVLVHTITFEK